MSKWQYAKINFTSLLICLCIVLVSLSEAGWFRRRRRTVVHNHYVHRCTCTVNCIGGRCTCNMNCRGACRGRKRMSQRDVQKGGGIELILPCKLDAWDTINKDGFVQLDEFMFTSRLHSEDQTGRLIFMEADRNGDGQLSANELASAPLRTENC